MQHDYYIALGVTYKEHYNFPAKRFYWATDATFRFEPMPQPNEQQSKDVDDRDTLFFGDPEKILVEIKPPDADQTDQANPPPDVSDPEAKTEVKKENPDDDQEAKPTLIPKNFTELDRLVFVVAAIENDTHVVPVGAFKLLPVHEVRRNADFKGIIHVVPNDHT